MNEIQRDDRTNVLIQRINYETRQLIDHFVEQFAVPYITGLSLDTLTQTEYILRGGVGPKPAPLSSEQRCRIYQKIHCVFTQQLYPMIFDALKPTLKRKHLNKDLSKHEFECQAFIKQNDWLVAAIQSKLSTFTPNIFYLAQLQHEL